MTKSNHDVAWQQCASSGGKIQREETQERRWETQQHESIGFMDYQTRVAAWQRSDEGRKEPLTLPKEGLKIQGQNQMEWLEMARNGCLHVRPDSLGFSCLRFARN